MVREGVEIFVNVVAIVTARGGSKGIIGKNLAPIAGKPMIAWTIDAARRSTSVRRVVVSTDCDEIARVARVWGAEVPFRRPEALARDDSSHLSVVLHALEWIENDEGRAPDYLLLLQPTSPLRLPEDIDRAVALAAEKGPDGVVSVCVANPHPWLVKRMDADGHLAMFCDVDSSRYLRRQDFPPAYSLNGAIYLVRPEALRSQRTLIPRQTLPLVMPAERSLDIDDAWDLHLARLIMEDQACNARKSA